MAAQAFSSLFIGMVCEARTGAGARGNNGVAFSSLFIGMVCEAEGKLLACSAQVVFQFPLHRDGV